MRLKILSIILTTALLACNNEEKQADQSANVQAATLVEVIVAQKAPLTNSVKSIGSLIANESVELSTQVGGTVEQINFKEGTFVKKGRLLLSVFNADLVAELNEIKARKQLAQTQLERNKKLLKAEGVSQEVVDQAQANYDELAASEQRLQAEIAKTKVHAPFDGMIGLRQVSKGDYLA
ncbi:MAG: efflux RND transporter periplasmic adaptor subunit, partial [Vicingaceae bacterium]